MNAVVMACCPWRVHCGSALSAHTKFKLKVAGGQAVAALLFTKLGAWTQGAHSAARVPWPVAQAVVAVEQVVHSVALHSVGLYGGTFAYFWQWCTTQQLWYARGVIQCRQTSVVG
jgi:hypothetical protein